MAKRFTDSDKWRDPWFKRLKGKHQLLWLFMLDTCDHAGIWKDQFDDFTHITGIPIDLKEANEAFMDRIFKLNDDCFVIPKFINFQYPKFNPVTNNAHKGVQNRLSNYGLSQELLSPMFASGYKHNDKEGLVRGTGIGIGIGVGYGYGIGKGTGIGTDLNCIVNKDHSHETSNDFFKGINNV